MKTASSAQARLVPSWLDDYNRCGANTARRRCKALRGCRVSTIMASSISFQVMTP